MTVVIQQGSLGGVPGTYGTAAGWASFVPPTWSDPGVTRRIGTTPGALAHRLEGDPGLQRITLAGLGELRIDPPARSEPAGAADPWPAGAPPVGLAEPWHAGGRLVGAGPRLARSTRIDIEVRAASCDSAEVRLLPRSRHIHRWAARRQRRYFQLAHAAADRLEQVLSA